MKIHHIGIACNDIEIKIQEIKNIQEVYFCSEIIFDEQQSATVCLLKPKEGLPIELVSGKPVLNLLKRGLTYYHLGYSVSNITEESKRLRGAGVIPVTVPKPAILFDNRLVAFFYSPYGLIELIEE